MATIVCQGLQKCLESQLNEPRTLRLKLASPKPQVYQFHELTLNSFSFLDSNINELEEKCKDNLYPENKQVSTDPHMGGWSFLQDLGKNSKETKLKEQEKTYVHPSEKFSSPKLSEKSLKMCTEDLGNETGTDITESSIFSSSNSAEFGDFPTRKELKFNNLSVTKKVIPRDFPPPLTTLTGSESLEVRREKEGGRLVIKVIKKPSNRTCFHAERTDGRLRLCILRDDYCPLEDDEDMIDEKDMIDENENGDEYEEDDENESDEKYCLKGAVDCDKDMYVEAEVGMEKFQRLSRCKERQRGSKMSFNWEPFCMATS